MIRVQGVLPLRFTDKARIPVVTFNHRTGMLVKIQVHIVHFIHRKMEHATKRAYPLNAFDSAYRSSFFLGELVAIPKFALRSRLTNEENLTVTRL